MASISRANVYDVLKNKPRDRVVVVGVEKDGKRHHERRIIKRPEGRCVEQFVDPSGHVVWIQLLQLGTNHGVEMIDKNRAQKRRDGFIEYHLCPLRHGTSVQARFEEEFLELLSDLGPELRRPCECDPVIHEKRGKSQHANDPCPHIAALIDFRRRKAAELADLRATKIETAADIEKQKLALQERQLEEMRETNRRLIEIAASNADKSKGKRDKDA